MAPLLSRAVVGGAQRLYRWMNPPPAVHREDRRNESLFRSLKVEDIIVHTEDDARLTITRKRPRKPTGNHCPIFCLPGLCETRFVLDQALGNSVVDYLASAGFDVYVGELRGAGKSHEARARYEWTVDHYLRYDLPAIINRIREVSEHDEIIWVGHSMGGMLLYAWLIEAAMSGNAGVFDDRFVRAGVTIGSPVSFSQTTLFLWAMWHRWSGFRSLPYAPTGALAKMLALFPRLLESDLTSHFWNWRNIEPRNKILYLQEGLDDVAHGVLDDFAEFMFNGDFTSTDRRTNYRRNLYLVTKPMLVIGGTADRMAAQDTVETAHREISSTDKELRMFGREGYLLAADGTRLEMNDHCDYGHVDLTLGRTSKREVWPYMLAWIREHARDGAGSQREAAAAPAPIPIVRR